MPGAELQPGAPKKTRNHRKRNERKTRNLDLKEQKFGKGKKGRERRVA